MTFTVRFLPGALDDLRRQSMWYESRKIGLAARFELAVRQQIKLLETIPRAYKEVYLDVRRCSVPKFPYEIYFRVTDDVVAILAVHGVRQDPEILKAKIG